MRSTALAAVALASIGLLASCATPARFERGAADQALVFQAEGRLSVTAPDDVEPSRSTNLSGKFIWIERTGSTELGLSSPLGDTLARLMIEPGRVELRTPGNTELGNTPEELMSRRLGVELPVSGLRYWLRGANRADQMLAPQGFDEDGWRISYPSMDASGKPRQVRLERDLPRPVQVRIVVDQWGGAS
ncbi:lipoprotein insertase outer membrane protein LolB [soil metagenome]